MKELVRLADRREYQRYWLAEHHGMPSIASSSLAGPIILANLFQTIYQLADTFWVGRIGAEAVAAVSISFPIIFLGLTGGVLHFYVYRNFGRLIGG